MFATEHQTEENPKPLADIIREETDDGRHIVRFLIDVMQGKVDDSKPCHRLDAARQLLNLGFDGARSVIQSASQSAGVRAPSSTPVNSRFDQGIADIIKLETSDGRDAVRFLVDVMQGNLEDFKPHHRLSAAKELLRRGFDNSPDHNGEHDVEQCKDDTFDYKKYARERFMRDGADGKALRHIYGSKEAVTVANRAVVDHRRKTVLDDTHIPDRDFTPIDNPGDDPYGKGCYGYNTLRLEFGDNQAIRVANKAVEEFKKRKAEHSEGESENEGPPVDRPSTSFPQQNGNSSSDEDDTMPPDHWSRKYMERIRIRSTEADKSSEDPDPPSSVPPERPQNPNVGAGFKPDRGLARPSTGRESKPPENPDPGQSKAHKLSNAKDPPKKRPVKIYLGPPDDSPRQCRDPGDFQSAIDSIWSAAPL